MVIALCGCSKDAATVITDPLDYNKYLSSEVGNSYKDALGQKEFWSARLRPDSSGIGDLGPLAAAYTQLFDVTGEVKYLHQAEMIYRKAISIASDNSRDGYQRGLAHNLISQHRFGEARDILEESYQGVSDKHQTELMLFDVYMELGDYKKADLFLGKIKNVKDYHFLIRLSKWMDHRGDLEAAIRFMEQARDIANSRDSKELKIWTYSNLGDYYGHAGRVEDSYSMYLRTLELQPDNAYVKKGLAWIVFSAENNTAEANRILDSVMTNHRVPEYYLLKADLSEFEGDLEAAEQFRLQFARMAQDPGYGSMYAAYLIEHYAERDPEKAVSIALEDVRMRPTPEAYQLLAFAQLKNGQDQDALSTINDHVDGYTSEPVALYHSALVYKHFGMNKKVSQLREELLGAEFEMGPLQAEKVKNL